MNVLIDCQDYADELKEVLQCVKVGHFYRYRHYPNLLVYVHSKVRNRDRFDYFIVGVNCTPEEMHLGGDLLTRGEFFYYLQEYNP